MVYLRSDCRPHHWGEGVEVLWWAGESGEIYRQPPKPRLSAVFPAWQLRRHCAALSVYRHSIQLIRERRRHSITKELPGDSRYLLSDSTGGATPMRTRLALAPSISPAKPRRSKDCCFSAARVETIPWSRIVITPHSLWTWVSAGGINARAAASCQAPRKAGRGDP